MTPFPTRSRHAFENDRVLDTVHVLVGLVAPEITRISIETDAASETVTLHIAATAEPQDPELVDDIVTGLIATYPGTLRASARLWIGDWRSSAWPGHDKRTIFGRWMPDDPVDDPDRA